MKTSKQNSIQELASRLAVLGLDPQATSVLARKIYGGVPGEYLPLPTKTVGKEIVLYGDKATVCLDMVTCTIECVISK